MKPISFPVFLNALVPASGGSQSTADPIETFSRLLSEFEASGPAAGSTAAAAPISVDPELGPTLPVGPLTPVALADATVEPPPAVPNAPGGAPAGSRTGADAVPGPDQPGLTAWSGLPLPTPRSLRRTDEAISASEDDPADDGGAAEEEAHSAGTQPAPAAVLVQIPPVPTAQAGSVFSSAIEELAASAGSPRRPLPLQEAAPFGHESRADPVAGPSTTDPSPGNFALVIEQNGLGAPIAHSLKALPPRAPASPADSSAALPVDSDLRQLDALVRDIAELSGSSARAAFKVEGRELGQVDVRLHASDAGVSVAIRTDSEHGRSAVAAAQGQLSDDMRSNGLKIAATSISFGQGGAERHRDDRQHASRPAFVETAASEAKQSQSPTDRRPSGRFA